MDSQFVKTMAGIGAGVGVAYFLFKNKNVFFLTGMGIAGGVLANVFFPQGVSEEERRRLQAEEDIRNSMIIETEKLKQNFNVQDYSEAGNKFSDISSGKTLQFNEEYGYIMPVGEVDASSPNEEFDISYNE